MGSIEGTADLGEIDSNDVVVLVTGFGPFRAQYPINPSWEIASSLSPVLTPTNTHKTDSSSATSPGQTRRIRILVHPSPVRVSYATVRTLVPQLWKSVPVIDFMVHIGMAAGREFYSVERRGHRDGFRMADVDGKACEDERIGDDNRDDWVWQGCPEEIVSGVDIDDVWKRWKNGLPDDVSVRPSEDAGRYLCDFMYYCSLAELWKAKQERRVVFLHVPVQSSKEAIETGKQVTEELIRALVASRDGQTLLASEQKQKMKAEVDV